MTEQIQDHVSAFVDDELSIEECAFLVRRLERDPVARRKLVSYSTIGSVLRGELLLPDPALLRRRVQLALDGAPPQTVTPNVSRAGWGRRAVRPVVAGGIAASAALAGLLFLRASNEVDVSAVVESDARPMQAGVTSEPRSYVVPQDLPASRTASPPIRLTNYLVHHGEYASGLGRTSVHSNVVGMQATTVADVSGVVEEASLEPISEQ